MAGSSRKHSAAGRAQTKRRRKTGAAKPKSQVRPKTKELPDWSLEDACDGPVAGLDEAGRGPLAGPVVAAAVILDPDRIPPGIRDSKTLDAAQREQLHRAIVAHALAVSVAAASVAEIDRLNVLRASLLAMERAVARLPMQPAVCLVDGNQAPQLPITCRCVVGGDHRSLSIAAAGIVAKVVRDRIMARLDRRHPGYGWATNAGYGVREHMDALRSVGVTPHHRSSFAPVREILLQLELPIT
ncbi:MAG: ribonuclease HII [Alphaproteobacteria bacterium]|nr:MAG: ribonuclease HII [Alphaproteobacteria bacterium]